MEELEYPEGKNKEDLDDPLKIGTVRIVVNDDGAYPTMGERSEYIDANGQEWVKFNGKFWKYPEGVDR